MPAEPFISNWGASIRDCYEICKDHITEMQKPANSGPEYWNDFRILYDAVVSPRAAQLPGGPKCAIER